MYAHHVNHTVLQVFKSILQILKMLHLNSFEQGR